MLRINASTEQNKKTSLKHFMQTSTLNSLQYVQNKEFSVKIIWICVNILLVGITVSIITTLWIDFMESPTVTTLENTNFPVKKVPFPAVGICNINKISRKKADELAIFMFNHSSVKMNIIKDYIKALGSVYDIDDTYIPKLMQFQRLFERLPNSSQYGLREVMKNLAPSCEDFLESCSWMRHKVNCSEIFQTRLTFQGYCCIFNYVKSSTEKIAEPFLNNTIHHAEAGVHAGLTFVLNHNVDDYLFTNLDTIGANIHLFNPGDYPDKHSGSLTEVLVELASETFIQVKPLGLHTMKDTINYPADKRQCFFPFEKTTFLKFYSESNCLMHCKLQSMSALCHCVPFMFPQNLSDICTLADLDCLTKYKAKWQRLQPPDILFHSALQREAHFALVCEHRCFPVCNSYLYQITRNTGSIKEPDYTNRSVVHVYYNSRHARIFKQDVRYYWFEILSNFGGISGVFLGVSLITVAEILLFCTRKVRNYIYYNVIYEDDLCTCIYHGFK